MTSNTDNSGSVEIDIALLRAVKSDTDIARVIEFDIDHVKSRNWICTKPKPAGSHLDFVKHARADVNDY